MGWRFNRIKMKAKSIIYSRLSPIKGNLRECPKIEIELEVLKKAKNLPMFTKTAKAFVEKRIAVEKMSDYTIEKARKGWMITG